jgi:dTMP kinase
MGLDKKGKLIVIDGSDGSGKATQTKMLVERLKSERVKVETLDFPRYEKNLMGKLIGESILGDHGDFLHLDPYITSVLYAADRFESRDKIQKWLSEGRTVVLDRYVSANQIHQGGKIKNPQKRRAFLEWLDRLEYGVFGLPKPNLTIYLYMPLEHSMKLLKDKYAKEKKGSYLKKGKKDTVENDKHYLMNARKSADYLMKHHKGWHKINCATRKGIRPREEIHEELFQLLERK